MDRLQAIVYSLDHALNTKRKRHITGGILLSISLLFGGLALTIMSLRTEDSDEQRSIE